MLRKDVVEGKWFVLFGIVFVLAIFLTYRLMTPALMMGEGLAFNHIEIKRQGDDIRLTGEIVNDRDEPRGVPSIRVVEKFSNDVEGDSILVAPSQDVLQSGEVMAFSITLEDVDQHVENITVTFAGAGKQQKQEVHTSSEAKSDTQNHEVDTHEVHKPTTNASHH
jgi:hypothetical protein